MELSKRERVIRTIEVGGNSTPDKLPIFSWGFERTAGAWKHFLKSQEFKNLYNDFLGKISWETEKRRKFTALKMAEGRFLNLDVHPIDNFKKLTKPKIIPAPPEYPGLYLGLTQGRLLKRDDAGHYWYVDGYFTSRERVDEIWGKYGKPHERLYDEEYSPQKWEQYVENMKDCFFPIGTIPLTFSEAIIEGVTPAKLGYYMRKKPDFVHYLQKEYMKTAKEIINRLSDAGVEVCFFGDDLGQKMRTLLSPKNFKEFVLPYYKGVYQHVRKKGMLLIQHSCGFIDPFVPLMADAGLHCIQSLQKTAGVDLANLVEKVGDKIAFMGALDDSRTLKFGTNKEIEEDVKNCIKIAGQNGNYGPGLSNSILNPPWNNLLAMREYLEKYRDYPLNF